MNLQVFYHLYIPPNEFSVNWIWWVDSQLKLIIDSNLHKYSNVNMCITMPKSWVHYNNIPYLKVSDGNPCTFEQYVVDYINLRYPFVKILDVRDTLEENIFEGQTLDKLKEFCDQDKNDSFILYFHSKGSSTSLGPSVIHRKAWKDFVDHHVIYDWKNCLKHLFDNDVVGVSDLSTVNVADFRRRTSANYWWTKSSYVKTLPNPILSSKYMYPYTPELFEGNSGYRNAFEFWVHIKFPKLHYVSHFNSDIVSPFFNELHFLDLNT